MWDTFSKDFSQMLKVRRSAAVLTSGAHSRDARLSIEAAAGQLHFVCTATGYRFFSLTGRLHGDLSVTIGESHEGSRKSSIQVVIGVETGGETHNVGVVCVGLEQWLDETFQLRRATRMDRADDLRHLEFVFGRDETEVSYNFAIPRKLDLKNFHEVVVRAPIFKTPPPVQQMAAFLRASLKNRQSPLDIIEDIVSNTSQGMLVMVRRLRDVLKPRTSLVSPELQLLVDHLNAIGRPFNPNVLAAWCLLVDMSARQFSVSDIERMGDGVIHTSFEALAQVAKLIDIYLDPGDWQRRFAAAGLPFPARLDRDVDTSAQYIIDLIKESRAKRGVFDILQNLVRQSPSQRASEILSIMALRHKEPTAANLTGFDAYAEFLQALGCKVHVNTLAAFCLYVEIETGRLNEERLQLWFEDKSDIGLSFYSLVAVASAFDQPLLACTVDIREAAALTLGGLLDLSPRGVLLGLEQAGSRATTMRFMAGAEEARERLREGWRFSGDVLLQVPILDALDSEDLSLFLRHRHSFMACFQADLDRKLVWRRMVPGTPNVDGNFSFAEGFRTFHFQNRVIASLDELTTSASGVETWRDQRGKIHYRDAGDPPGRDMKPAELVLTFPKVDSVPDLISEMNHDRLLGRSARGQSEVRRLEVLQAALERVSAEQHSAVRLDEEARTTLKTILSSSTRLQQALRQVMELKMLDTMLPLLSRLDIWVYEPLVEALSHRPVQDLTALAVMYAVCDNVRAAGLGRLKNFDDFRFRNAMRAVVLEMMDAAQPRLREIACLACTYPLLLDEDARPLLEFELTRAMDDEAPEVQLAAAISLTRMALEDVLPAARLSEVRKSGDLPGVSRGTSSVSMSRQLNSRDVQLVANELQAWMTRMVARFLDVDAGREPNSEGAGQAEVHRLAMLLAAARRATEEEIDEGSLLVITTWSDIQNLAETYLKTWSDFAAVQGLSHQELQRELEDPVMQQAFLDDLPGDSPLFLNLARLNSQPTNWVEAGVPRVFYPMEHLNPLWVMDRHKVRTSPLLMAMWNLAASAGADQLYLGRIPWDRVRRRFRPPTASVNAALGLTGERLLLPAWMELLNVRAATFEHFTVATRTVTATLFLPQELDFLEELPPPYGLGGAEEEVLKRRQRRMESDRSNTRIIPEQEPPERLAAADRLLTRYHLPDLYLDKVLMLLRDSGISGGS